MLKTTKIAITIILIALVAMAAPASASLYYGQSESDKAEKIVELADRAGERVEDLIDLISLNTTAIEVAGLIDQFNLNVSRFNTGMENVTLAYTALAAEDYEGAIANATDALDIFKEVLSAIHLIMEESGISKGDIIEAQGLLTAMERALERIERLRELLPEDAEEALALLDEAMNYLDIDEAQLWLLDGRVTETAHNLTEANSLISEAHGYLKDQAKESNSWRINNYIGQMERAQERVMERYQYGDGEGVEVDAVLKSLGYENMNEFMNALQSMIEGAQGNGDIKDVINELKEIGKTIREADNALGQEIGKHRHGQEETGNGNSGYGQENTGNGNTQTGDSGSAQGNSSGNSDGQSQGNGNGYENGSTSGGQSGSGSTGSGQGSTGNGNGN